ncbi:MAG: signal peptidase I [Candidatus Nanopelagicales bacterium]
MRLLREIRHPGSRSRRIWMFASGLFTAVFVFSIGILAWPATLGGKATWVSVSGTSMEPNYHTGDLVLAWNDQGWQLGDVILYGIQGSTDGLIVHRLVSGNAQDGWYAQGDNKPRIDPWRISNDAIGGREILHVPNAGTALTWVRSPQVLAIICGLLVFWAVLTGPRYMKRRLERVPIAEPAVVDGHAARTMDLHREGGRFSLPVEVEVAGTVPIEVWVTRDSTTQIARGTLTIAHNVATDDKRLVGGPIVWDDDAHQESIDSLVTSAKAAADA